MAQLILLILAIVLFLLAAADVTSPHVKLVAAGLAAWALSELVVHPIW